MRSLLSTSNSVSLMGVVGERRAPPLEFHAQTHKAISPHQVRQAFLQRLGIYHSEQLRGIDLVSEVQLLVGHLPILLRKALLSRFRRIFVPKGF